MTADQKYAWATYLNPEGTKKFVRVKKNKQKPTKIPPEPGVPSDFSSLSKLKPVLSNGSTQAAHIAEALEEKEN